MADVQANKVIGAHLQDCIVRLAIQSDEFLRIVRPVLPPKLFTSQIPANLFQLCVSYWDTFRKAPGDHFHDEFVRFISQRPESDKKYYIDYVDRIRGFSNPDLSYVLERLNEFIRARRFEEAAVEFAEHTARGDFSQAEQVMYSALKSGIGKFELGLDYLHTKGLPGRSDPERSKFLMRTGFKPLDRVIGGYKRGQFIVWMGGYKGKKSWSLMHTAVTALTHGLTVVHISHEMTTEEIETRYDMMIGGLSSDESLKPLKLMVWNEDAEAFDETTITPKSVYDWDRVKKARRVMRRFGGRLIVKKYPMGLVNMQEVNRYLQHLEIEGINVDVLINDYADIMAPIDYRKELRHQINETYIYHKRLADERNILVFTATQVPDSAIRKATVTIRDFSEDRRKAGNVDMALALCQTDEQEEDCIATVMIVANRTGVQGYRFLVGAVPQIGQLALWSAPIKNSYAANKRTD